MKTGLSKAAADSYRDRNLASAVARRVSRLLAEGGWQRSIATSSTNRSEGFVVSRLGYSSQIQIYWSHSTHLSPVIRDSPEWNKARENERQMWQFICNRGYIVDKNGHIDVAKHYYTPPPEQRTPEVMRKLDKLDDERLAHIAAMEQQAWTVELLAATKEAEEAFRAFAQSMKDDPTIGNDASAETALQIAERLHKAALPFRVNPIQAPHPLDKACDDWTKSENEVEFQS